MKKWVNSARLAFRGIVLLIQTERNARIELAAACLALGLAFMLHLRPVEWCIILLSIGGVITAEAINSSIERVTNMYSTEQRQDIADIKDIAAGAVLVIAGIAFICGIIIFAPKLAEHFL